ncbi:hypothetical protein [Nitrosomonas aestuarii]|uniref:hypothetical protein n=1 Tax=Nitrosomonas aestuarii TaxID=52441 RepID=UPI00147B8DD0|nr:hypothetical protein [Nitrosomonas aestuarii]
MFGYSLAFARLWKLLIHAVSKLLYTLFAAQHEGHIVGHGRLAVHYSVCFLGSTIA